MAVFRVPWGKCIFYNFTYGTKLMILFNLPRLGIFFSWNFMFLCNCCGFVLFFYENRFKIILQSLQHCWQLNSVQYDVCFNHLGQKLWEKIHFLQPKVNFPGKGKNKSIWTKCQIYNVNNKNCWYIVFLLLHWWNNIEICQKNKFHPPPAFLIFLNG